MSQDQRSLFFYCARAFGRTVAIMLGLGIGFALMIGIIGAAVSGKDGSGIDSQSKISVLANPDGTRSRLQQDTPLLLQVDITGQIGMGRLTTNDIQELLAESREGVLQNDRVKGILLRIRSPGGGMIDSFGIYQAIKEYRDNFSVPVYAYSDGLCASGGLLIAMAADKIYSSPYSLNGSVGVIIPPFFNVEEFARNLGIQALTISAGKDKDAMNPLRKWSDDEDENVRDIVASGYDLFVDHVVAARPLIQRDELINDLGARMFTGDRAKEVGLVDVIVPSISSVIQDLAKEAGITTQDYQVIELAPRFSFPEFFGTTSAWGSKMTHEVKLPGMLPDALRGQLLCLWQANPVQSSESP